MINNLLLDPNVGFVLLVGGFVFAILALFSPGTGILEVGALFALLLAGYTLVTLPVNGWAIVVMIVAVFPLVFAVRGPRGGSRGRSTLFLIAGIFLLILGSIFVFRTAQGGPAVNPILAVIVSGGSGLLLWFMARKSLEAALATPRHNLDRLIGMVGIARTDLRPEGTVYVGGEEWTAISSSYIPSGAAIKVIARQGLILTVEQVKLEE